MGNKVPASAVDISAINTTHELKAYFKTHHFIEGTEIHDQQLDEIITSSLNGSMPLVVFQYLIDKIGNDLLNNEYDYIKAHLTYSDKSLYIISKLHPYRLRDFVNYTFDVQLLEHIMYYVIKKRVVSVLVTLIERYRKIDVSKLAQYHSLVLTNFHAEVMETFDKLDPTFDIKTALSEGQFKKYKKQLTAYYDSD